MSVTALFLSLLYLLLPGSNQIFLVKHNLTVAQMVKINLYSVVFNQEFCI